MTASALSLLIAILQKSVTSTSLFTVGANVHNYMLQVSRADFLVNWEDDTCRKVTKGVEKMMCDFVLQLNTFIEHLLGTCVM